MKKSATEELPLKQRLLDATARIFAEEGYGAVSMRRVAAEAGCSQMAAYRYFESKESLIQQVCAELYQQFASRMVAEMAKTDDPWRKIRRFATALLRFGLAYPDHYSLIFLVRHPDPQVIATREQLASSFLAGVRATVATLLPASATASDVNDVLRRMMSFAHGTMALLLAHPQPYGLTRTKALRDIVATFELMLGQDRSRLKRKG